MLVSCPSCSTTYRVSDKLITTSNPTFRCSRCKYIFVLELKSETIPEEETSSHPSETRQEEEEKSPELEFSFRSIRTDTTEHETEEDSLPTGETQPPVTDSLDQEPEDSYPTEE
ncbi:MAG: zinc-ribbon domain-containing protein, partial [Candidatus Binatia bacterium]